MRGWVIVAWIALLLGLAACGGGGNAERGRAIYMGEVVLPAQAPNCVMCHPVVPGERAQVMGQNLSNIGNRAANTVPGQSTEEYLRTAILDPDAHLSGNFQEGIMYRRYKNVLTPQQVEDLVAYMLTLRSGQD